MSRTRVIVDTETTGLGHVDTPPRRDGVVQVGLAYRDDDGEVETWSTLCNPGREYLRDGRADKALEVNGLEFGDVLEAPPVQEASRRFWDQIEALESRTGATTEFRSFNLDFDGPFLASEPWAVAADRWGPCIMKRAAVHLNGPAGKWPKLEVAVRRMGLEWPEGPAHDAGVDSHAALLVDEVLEESGRASSWP